MPNKVFEQRIQPFLTIIGLGGSAMVELAMASYLSLYPALLLPPFFLLCQKGQAKVSPFFQRLITGDIGWASEIVKRIHCCVDCVVVIKLYSCWIMGLSPFNIRSNVFPKLLNLY